MTHSIKLGIAGTGRMAARLVQALAHLPDIKVQAVASGDTGRAKWFADQCGAPVATSSVSEMASSPSVDAIYVAGRTRDHAAAALEAVRAGKPVLVEKPLALSLDVASTLVRAAQDKGSLVMENLWCLALPAYRALHDQLNSGRYGTGVQLHFDFGYPVQPDSYPSLFDPEDGGAILDRGVYGVSLSLQLLGPVTKINCTAQTNDAGLDLNSDLLLQHASGSTSHIAVSLNAFMSNTASLACSHGYLGLESPVIGSEILKAIQMQPQSASQIAPKAQTGVKQTVKTWSVARRLKRLREMSAERFLSYGPDPYMPVLKHFRDLVRHGARESELIPLQLSLRTQEILHEARRQVVGA